MPRLKMPARDLVTNMVQGSEVNIVGEVAEDLGRLWEVYGRTEAKRKCPASQFLLWRSSKPFS